MLRKRPFYMLLILITMSLIGFWYYSGPSKEYVNVYNWYAMLPKDVLRDFTTETGIHVRLDFYDNNDVLETKLFAGNSGYDIVFPSASPYLSRQIKAGVFHPLDLSLLPNRQDLESSLIQTMETADPGNLYAIPYYWGTLGFAFDVDKVEKILGKDAPLESYQMLFDPEILKRLAPFGITLLEEATDIYPLILRYLGKSPHSTSKEDLQEAHNLLLTLRPFIRRFSSSRLVGELVSGETCLAQAWSGDTQTAIREAANMGRRLRYVIPKEGSTLWIDAMAIPKDAPNLKNAHIFMNFLLRPDITARVSAFCLLATPTRSARALLPQELREDETLFPPPEIMEKLTLDEEAEVNFERERNRMWTNFKLNRTGF